MAIDYRRLSRRARHLVRRLKRTKHASVQQVTVHELDNEIHRRRFGRATRETAPVSAARVGHWRPLSHRAKKLLTHLRRAKVWVVQRRLIKELVAEMQRGRRLLNSRLLRPVATRARRTLARGKRAASWAKRTRSSWASTGRAWQSAREPQARAARPPRPGPARTPPTPAGRLAPGSRPAPARPARTRS